MTALLSVAASPAWSAASLGAGFGALAPMQRIGGRNAAAGFVLIFLVALGLTIWVGSVRDRRRRAASRRRQ